MNGEDKASSNQPPSEPLSWAKPDGTHPVSNLGMICASLAILGILSGILYAFCGFVLEFWVGGGLLEYYEPSVEVAFDRQVILGEANGTMLLHVMLPIVTLALIGLTGWRLLRFE